MRIRRVMSVNTLHPVSTDNLPPPCSSAAPIETTLPQLLLLAAHLSAHLHLSVHYAAQFVKI